MGSSNHSGCSSGCGQSSTKTIRLEPPGKPIQIAWEEYIKEWDGLCDGALAVGVPYYIEDAPCPGWYIPNSASQGKASDLVLQRRHFTGTGSPFDWDEANCRFVIDWEGISNDAETLTLAEWGEIGCPSSGTTQGDLLYSGPDGLRRVPVSQFLAGLPLSNIPNAGQTCGTIKQLVLVEDGDCSKMAFYSEAESGLGVLRFDQTVEGTSVPQETAGLVIPDNMPDPATFYLLSDFQADGANGGDNFDEAKIASKVILEGQFQNVCPRTVDFDINVSLRGYPTVQEAYERLSTIAYRYRVDGGAWVYARDAAGNARAFAFFNAVSPTHRIEAGIALPAGQIEIQFFWIAVTDPPAQLSATTISTAPASPVARLRPAIG